MKHEVPIETVKSPCNRDCKLDPKRMYCVSCFRTLQEIAGWRDLSDQERERLMREVDGRRADKHHICGK